jgi:hypothetical protein
VRVAHCAEAAAAAAPPAAPLAAGCVCRGAGGAGGAGGAARQRGQSGASPDVHHVTHHWSRDLEGRDQEGRDQDGHHWSPAYFVKVVPCVWEGGGTLRQPAAGQPPVASHENKSAGGERQQRARARVSARERAAEGAGRRWYAGRLPELTAVGTCMVLHGDGGGTARRRLGSSGRTTGRLGYYRLGYVTGIRHEGWRDAAR